MKPQFIKMKAFGSYRDERIDFSEVQQGLFLITGDTGAGKTTIFDAIMFALYGETSGGKREGKMMRSQYAPEGMATEVEFGFSYRGELYIIKRRPQQPRYKKNKQTGKLEELKTQMPARAELIMPDGKEFHGKIAQVNEKIIQITGLNADQFTQVAMLAQGDFVKLLHASSKDRKEIFAKMFDTRIYGCIQDELKQRHTAKTKELYGNRKDIVRELREISLIKGSKYEKIWNSDLYMDSNGDHFSESDAEGLSALIGKVRKEAQEKEDGIQEDRKKNEERMAQIHAVLENAALINGQLDRLTERKQHLKALSGQAEEMQRLGERIQFAEKAKQMIPFYQSMIEKERDVQESRNQLEKLNKRMEAEKIRMNDLEKRAERAKEIYEAKSPGLQIAIDQIEKSLDQYDIYEKIQKEQETALKAVEHADKQIQRLKGQIALYEDQSAILSEEIDELKSVVCNVEVLEARLKEESRRREDLNEISEDLDKLDLLEQLVLVKEESYKRAKEEAEEQASVYREYQQKFIANQALILRNQLEVGKPCPVCGKIHEKMEKVVDDIPNEGFNIDERTLKKLQSGKEKADAEYMAAKSALDVARTKNENLRLSGQRKMKRVFDGADGFDLSWEAPVKQQLQNVETAIERCRKKIQENTQTQEQIKTKEILLAEKKQQKNDYERSLQNKKEQREAYDKKADICQTKTTMMASHLAFQTKSEAEAELERRKLELSEISSEKKECENSFMDADKIYTASRGELKKTGDYLEKAKIDLENAKKTFSEQLKVQGFSDQTEFEYARMNRDELDFYMEQKQSYENDIRETKIIIRELEISTEGKQKTDISGYEEEQRLLKEEKQQLEKNYTDIRFIVQNDKKVHERVKNLYKEREKLNRELLVLSNLSDTANGKMIGKQRINFETYMQRRFFKNIIYHANKRLQIMSNGQFILQCRELEKLGSSNAEVGLDLDVYSLVNQQSRDVKTLSGGESFVAALSMALGMADIIQSSHGSIHIDTMFIDEGFGSLSEDTRNQAISILNELSGGKRLVGIISHVSELKNQVERQLIIQKTEKGSRHYWKI